MCPSTLQRDSWRAGAGVGYKLHEGEKEPVWFPRYMGLTHSRCCKKLVKCIHKREKKEEFGSLQKIINWRLSYITVSNF